MPEFTTTQIKDTTANPAPLGLLAFGMTTVLEAVRKVAWKVLLVNNVYN